MSCHRCSLPISTQDTDTTNIHGCNNKPNIANLTITEVSTPCIRHYHLSSSVVVEILVNNDLRCVSYLVRNFNAQVKW